MCIRDRRWLYTILLHSIYYTTFSIYHLLYSIYYTAFTIQNFIYSIHYTAFTIQNLLTCIYYTALTIHNLIYRIYYTTFYSDRKIKNLIFLLDQSVHTPVSYTHLDVYKRQVLGFFLIYS